MAEAAADYFSLLRGASVRASRTLAISMVCHRKQGYLAQPNLLTFSFNDQPAPLPKGKITLRRSHRDGCPQSTKITKSDVWMSNSATDDGRTYGTTDNETMSFVRPGACMIETACKEEEETNSQRDKEQYVSTHVHGKADQHSAGAICGTGISTTTSVDALLDATREDQP